MTHYADLLVLKDEFHLLGQIVALGAVPVPQGRVGDGYCFEYLVCKGLARIWMGQALPTRLGTLAVVAPNRKTSCSTAVVIRGADLDDAGEVLDRGKACVNGSEAVTNPCLTAIPPATSPAA